MNVVFIWELNDFKIETMLLFFKSRNIVIQKFKRFNCLAIKLHLRSFQLFTELYGCMCTLSVARIQT